MRRLELPETVAAVQAGSPGVRITHTFGGNVGVSYWSVATPVHLIGGTGTCTFDLFLPKLPTGAAVLTGTHKELMNSFQVDSFGPMSEARAFAAISRVGMGLQSHGWVPTENVVQPTQAQVHALLRGGSGVSVRELRCGSAQLSFAMIQNGGHSASVTYQLLYDHEG